MYRRSSVWESRCSRRQFVPIVLSILIGVMLALVGVMVLCNAIALALIIAGDRKEGLSLVTVQPVLLVVAAVLAWWRDGTQALPILVLGPVAIVSAYAAGFGSGALVRRLRRRSPSRDDSATRP